MVQPTRELSSLVHNLEARAEDDAIAQGIRKSFIIFDVDTGAKDGRRLCLSYNLKVFPAIVVIEPSTGFDMCLMSGVCLMGGRDDAYALLDILT
ncbi:hypothetical protein RHSIM_Rhsim03G0166900 [Rhododendron simsii]|uniref:Thioredoxin domain-containing protein n=1 Tax=Rhododendron simsii TaxID=118357 RepID=A0A834H4C4_RHOSS|nr:hypothetical protein RHSIM_Rhsim03G0166900 [Rhododendron simsii]